MFKKILPIAAVALTFFAACSDDDSSTSVRHDNSSAEITEDSSDSVVDTIVKKRGAFMSCHRKTVADPVDSINFECNYDMVEGNADFSASIKYEKGTSKEDAVEFCENFMKENGFKDYKCDEGSESEGFHSTAKKSAAGLDVDALNVAWKSLCVGPEDEEE